MAVITLTLTEVILQVMNDNVINCGDSYQYINSPIISSRRSTDNGGNRSYEEYCIRIEHAVSMNNSNNRGILWVINRSNHRLFVRPRAMVGHGYM